MARNHVRVLLVWSGAVMLCSSAAVLCDDDHGQSVAAALDVGEKCARSPDLWPCLKKGGARLVGALVGYQGEIPLVGQYLSLVPDRRRSQDEGRRDGTPSSPSQSVYSKLLDFADRRLLRVSLPVNFVTWLVGVTSKVPEQEGRGKKDKGAGVLMLGGMMMITTLMSTAFGALALMAAKGLLTSILALMLSAMAVSKKSGGHGHARTTYEVINAPLQGYHQPVVSDYKLETEAVVQGVNNNPAQYQVAQTEPIQYGTQQYD